MSIVKKIIFGVLTCSILWILFIWCKYTFFDKVYQQSDINKIFAETGITPPVYDSININANTLYYLTNKGNAKSTTSKPYLVYCTIVAKTLLFSYVILKIQKSTINIILSPLTDWDLENQNSSTVPTKIL